MIPKRLKEYLLITGFVWMCYGLALPIYFNIVFHWGWNQIIVWWITGSPVEFILAYPIGKGLIWIHPKIRKYCKLPMSEEAQLVHRAKEVFEKAKADYWRTEGRKDYETEFYKARLKVECLREIFKDG